MFGIVITFGVWLALPLATLALMRRKTWQPAPVMALICGAALWLTVIWLRREGATLPPTTIPQHDTYFVTAYHGWLQQLVLVYAGVALAFSLIGRSGQAWARRASQPLFWLFHLGLAVPVMHKSIASVVLLSNGFDSAGLAIWSLLLTIGSWASMAALVAVAGVVCATMVMWIAKSSRRPD